ncbi:hypothetical protein RIF29_08957 [Crotalaria pallida]|uniref:Cation-transporting P-type ATPase N-terminal domain-containing protein n=1 Tax=Crotalaria pallida TaxID=3830 RepID=A0AAN9FZ44_CROPI
MHLMLETIKPPLTSSGEFAIGQEQLASISRDHDTTALQQRGGVAGISKLLQTDLAKGVHDDDAELLRRRNVFGSNNYPRKKGRSFLMFLWDACKDLTLIILIVAAAASLALGIKSEELLNLRICPFPLQNAPVNLLGSSRVDVHCRLPAQGIKEGWSWYDGGSIAFAVILVTVVTAISDYKQSLQFRDLNEEKRNIHLEVPADGILITGHSLAIDESSMTGESKIVNKDSKDPFLLSGCKVADGSGTMLVIYTLFFSFILVIVRCLDFRLNN